VNQRIFSRVVIYVVFLGTLISFQTPSASAVVASNPAAVCSGATCTVTFTSTSPADYYEWTTPLSGEFILEVWGGQGGVRPGGGGAGGYSKGTATIASGTVLYIYPGGAGAYNTGLSAGGFNGGGNSASGGEQQGGGGGATHIATSLGLLSTLSGNTASVLIVAGGGGGSDSNSNGGAGGGTTGGNGTTNPSWNGNPGIGGSQSAGGCANPPYTTGITCGVFGRGGTGDNSYGAGGGGGWRGGGGGYYDSGGGGGSGYLASALTTTSITAGVRSGAGQAIITYPNGPRVTSFTSSSLITNSSSITHSLTFSETVTGLTTGDFVITGTGSSTCSINLSGSGNSYTASLSSCSQGTVILTISANSVSNGSSQVGPTSLVSAPTVVIDQTAPTISTVTAPNNGTYKPVDTPTFTVAFSESVTVTGTPRLTLTVGSFTKYANYVSQTDSRTALFRYTVASNINEFDTDGISISNTLDLNSGSIADLATNSLSTLTFSAPNTSGILVAQPPAAPTIDSATAGSGFIRINFTAGATYGTPITNYQWSTNNGSNWTARSPVDTSTPLTISGLTNGTSYQVRIRAVSTVGNSDSSTSITATPNAVTVASGSNISTTFGRSDSSTAFTSSGGVGPYTYTLSTTVPGITISSGVVTTSSTLNAGTYSLNVVSTDSFLATGTKAITVTVDKATQETLTITSTNAVFNGAGSSLTLFTIGGTDTGTVTYAIAGGLNPSGCQISGSQLSVTSAGTCQVIATKAATTNYLVAVSETATITFLQFVSNQQVQTQSVPTELPIIGQNSLDVSEINTVPAITGVFLVGSTYEINGTGFAGVVRVIIGGTEASITSSTSSKIVVNSAGLMPGPLFIECSDGRVGPSPFYFFTP
jgi:hypothetical protein